MGNDRLRHPPGPPREPPRAVALIPPAVAAVVFLPITRNFFHQDDFLALYQLANRGPWHFLLLPHGGHLLVTRNALFALCFRVFGTDAAPYFRLALATHVLAVWLLFHVIRRSGGSAWLACFGATLWGTTPSSEGSLGWYAAYGHVVAGTMLLLLLWRLAARAQDERRVTVGSALGWAALLLLGGTSFGVGLAIAAVAPLAVALLLGMRRLTPASWLVLLATPVALAALYAAVLWRSLEATGDPRAWITGMLELWTSWGPVLRMWRHLLAYAPGSLVLGFLDVPPRYPTLASRIVLAAYAAGVGLLLLRGSWAARRQTVALLLLAAAAYGAIAVGRGAIYAALVPDLGATVTVPRYHYVALVPLTVVLCLVLRQVPSLAVSPRHALALWLAATATAYLAFAPPIAHHDDDRSTTAAALKQMRAEVDAYPPGGDAVIPNRPFPPAIVLRARFPGWAGLFMIYQPANTLDGRRVHFAVPAAELPGLLADGGRLATLLVAAEPPR